MTSLAVRPDERLDAAGDQSAHPDPRRPGTGRPVRFEVMCVVVRVTSDARHSADYVAPINALCEECGEADAYTLVCVDGTNMAVCRPCHVWLDHHSVPPLEPPDHIEDLWQALHGDLWDPPLEKVWGSMLNEVRRMVESHQVSLIDGQEAP